MRRSLTPASWLAEVEPLTDPARTRRMVELGRAATNDPTAAAVIKSLESGGWYERWLALRSCYDSRDGAHVLRAVADPSRLMRNLAICLAPMMCDDAQALDALALSTGAQTLVLIQGLRARKRFPPLDQYLAEVAERGDDRASTLIAYGSPDLVRRTWPAFSDHASRLAWERLTRLHPEIAGHAAIQRIATDQIPTGSIAWLTASVFPTPMHKHPDLAVQYLAALQGRYSLSLVRMQPLIQRRPAAVAQILLAGSERTLFSFAGVAHRLDDRQLEQTLERGDGLKSITGNWLRRLPPARRAAIFATYGRGWRFDSGVTDPDLVALLPVPLRHDEAKRHLALPSLV